MSDALKPNDHQQEDRASQAKQLAETIEGLSLDGSTLTLKGEAIEISKGRTEFVITANGDSTFSIKDGPSHLSADDVRKHLSAKL